MAWSDPKTIYACTFGSSDQVWRSNDGGTSWTDITPGGTSVPYNITVSGEDANIVWAVRTISWTWQGELNGSKVYKSTDGGANWTNISGSTLDGEYLTNIYHQKGTAGGVYVGTRRAVYYKNDALSDFVLFNNQLPLSTASTELVGNYGTGKLYNGTNRSVYKVDFYEKSSPVAQIAVDNFTAICTGDPIQFFSNSVALSGATFNWSFPTGSPSTSTSKNPVVVFNTLGSHDVSLTVTDANGMDTQVLSDFISTDNNCNPEAVPGMTLSTDGTSTSYAYAPDNDNLDFGTNTDFTLTAWVKTNTTSSDAVIMAKKDWDSGANNGWVMSIEDGHLWVNVGDGSNRVDLRPSELLNDNEWHYVAASFDRDGMATVYLDGENIDAVNMSGVGDIDNSKQFTIGADDEIDYRLAAQIDEVCIYDTALNQSEIREKRHLTNDGSIANLITYLQFNETTGQVFDRVGGTNHCTLGATASRNTSTAPVGGGESQTLNCIAGGVKDFADANLSIEFPASGTYPDGDLVVSRLNLNPNQNPSGVFASPSYWIINNYGNNTNFSELENIVFQNVGQIPVGSSANDYHLFKRNSNADGNWNTAIDDADIITTGANASATFSTGNSLTSFSQLIVGSSGASLPVDLVHFSARLNGEQEVDLHWVTASEINHDYFIVEKSKDGKNFLGLAKIPSKGNTSDTKHYDLRDENPFKGISYYRLKQVDVNGSYTYSDLESISINTLRDAIVVYPNPLAANQLLNIESTETEDLQMLFYDTAGKLMKEEILLEGNGKIDLGQLGQGVFYYQILGTDFLRNGMLVVE